MASESSRFTYTHAIVISIFVLFNVILASINVGQLQSVASYVLAKEALLYTLDPIERMFPPELKNAAGVDVSTYMKPWSDKATDFGLTDLQLAKFHLGCYSDQVINSGATVYAPWTSESAWDTWQEKDDIEKTMTLMNLQQQANGFGVSSVCTCIDQVHASRYDRAELETALTTLHGGLTGNHMTQYMPLMKVLEEQLGTDELYGNYEPIAEWWTTAKNLAQVPDNTDVINEAQWATWLAATNAAKPDRAEWGESASTFDDINTNVAGVSANAIDSEEFRAWRNNQKSSDLNGDSYTDEDELKRWQEIFYGRTDANAAKFKVPKDLYLSDTRAPDGVNKLSTSEFNAYASGNQPLVTAIDVIWAKRQTHDLGDVSYYSGIGSANMMLEKHLDKIDDKWETLHKEVSGTRAYGDSTEKQYKKDLVNFCMMNGVPQLTSTYQGVININALIFVGQLLITAAIIREFLHHLFDKRGDEADKRAPISMLARFLAVVLIFGGIVVFIVLQMQTAEVKQENVAYRNENHTQFTFGGQVPVFLLILLVLTGFVEFVYMIMFTKKAYDKDRLKNPEFMSKYALLYYETQNFLVFASGWTLLGIGFLLQSNVKHVNTIFSYVILIVGASAVQYVSNYFRIIYHFMFKYLDKVAVNAMQTTRDSNYAKLSGMTEKSAKGLSRFKHFMQFIAWGRLFITFTVLFHVILLITAARESSASNYMQSLSESRLLYYAFAFFFANCGFDIVYEVLPFVFDHRNARYVKIYFVLFYLTYINLIYRTSLNTALDPRWVDRIK